MTLKFKRVLEVGEDKFTENFIKLSSAVQELSCWQTFPPISQLWKIWKSGLDLDLWPMTFNSTAFVRLSRYMFVQNKNFIKLSAAVLELSW